MEPGLSTWLMLLDATARSFRALPQQGRESLSSRLPPHKSAPGALGIELPEVIRLGDRCRSATA